MAGKVEPAVATIGRLAPLDALKVAARALGGLGPGLTPAGDDMLSGILFAFRAMAARRSNPRCSPSPALSAPTTSPPRSSKPPPAATTSNPSTTSSWPPPPATANAAEAAADLDRFGSSSGADVAYGLRLAFTRS